MLVVPIMPGGKIHAYVGPRFILSIIWLVFVLWMYYYLRSFSSGKVREATFFSRICVRFKNLFKTRQILIDCFDVSKM